jgi:hypothetical protein
MEEVMAFGDQFKGEDVLLIAKGSTPFDVVSKGDCRTAFTVCQSNGKEFDVTLEYLVRGFLRAKELDPKF